MSYSELTRCILLIMKFRDSHPKAVWKIAATAPLSAKAQDLAPCYMPQQRFWHCAMGHRTGSGSLLWARVQNLIPHYDKSEEFNYGLWATAQNLFLRVGAQR